jgi:hypothetical protein
VKAAAFSLPRPRLCSANRRSAWLSRRPGSCAFGRGRATSASTWGMHARQHLTGQANVLQCALITYALIEYALTQCAFHQYHHSWFDEANRLKTSQEWLSSLRGTELGGQPELLWPERGGDVPTEFTCLCSLPASGRVSHGLASFPVTGDGAPRPEETL